MHAGHFTLGAATAYIAVGAAVAVWTANRASKKEKAFNGISATTSAGMALAQTVILWPYAVVYNLKK